jgi:hypothetical protein
MSNGSVSGMSVREIASILGRNQGPELFFQQPFTQLTSPIIPKNISLNRPMERLHFVWRGRITIAAAGFTPFPEALFNIIQRIRITGTHRRFGAIVPIDVTGGTVGRLLRLFHINGNFATPGFTGAIGDFDAEIHWELPVTPIVDIASKLSTTPFLWFKDDWQDTLTVQLFFGDGSALGGVAANVTFTAFGSGAGTPTVSIFTNYELLGALAQSFSSATVIRSEQPVQGVVTAVVNAIRLQQLQKQKTANIILKMGTIPAGLSAGVQAFGTLVDTILDFTQIVVDNKPLRNNFSNMAAKEYGASAFNVAQTPGYLVFPFIDSQNPLTAFRGDLLSGGSTFEVTSNVVTAGATQSVNIVQEQILGDPQAA